MRLFLIIGLCFLLTGFPQAFAQVELTWQDCVREAAQNHPDLIVATESIVQSKDDKALARGTALPQISADLNASANNSQTSGASNSFSYGVNGSQLIFDGSQTINNIHSAQANVQATVEAFKFTSSQIRLRLRSAYIDVLNAQKLLDLTKEIYKIRENDLNLIALRHQSGTEHKGALLTAKANLSQASYEIHQAERALDVAQIELNKEMGRASAGPFKVADDFAVIEDLTQSPDFESIAASHPSFLKASAQINAAAYDVKSAQGGFAPTLSLVGGIGKSGAKWTPSEQSSDIGLKVSVPIFEGGKQMINLNKSQSVYRQSQEQQRSIKDGIVLSLHEQWKSLQDAVENEQVQKSFVEAAVERSKIAEGQYSVGLITFDNWTIIQDDFVKNKKAWLNAQISALQSEAAWVQAKGETLVYER